MTNYSWELGFDWNALADPSLGDNICYLQHGLVNIDTLRLSPSVNLKNGDIIRFTIFDVTSGAPTTGKSSYRIASGSVISFRAAVANQGASPFSTRSVDIPARDSDTNLASQAFGLECPTWDQTPSQTISVSSGRYLMSVTLNVTDGTTTKTYSVDPEMVIGSDG